ncbi:hypothetical protein [Glutamicibacter sp. JC586]|uniref:hypothetical protein n=1 Tax=Glutamicibacter sp. JC586 TaxID=2590552 RepID=UPI001359594E|nr:hypothetical protein [Glutamicibacter sp. JC586]
MDQLSASALSVAIAATIIYLWLRSVATGGKVPALQRARSHSFWCALIAFFVSTSGELRKLWVIDGQTEPTISLIIIALSAGGWIALVYIIGLFTWPQELQPVRVASLEPRTFTSPFPRKLGALVGALAVVSIALLWPVSQVSGQSPQGYSETESTSDFGEPFEQVSTVTPGWHSGTEVAPLLALSILGVLVAAALVSFVILKRQPLTGISTAHNQQLRTVWLNRLLRHTGWILVGISVSAISYADPILGPEWSRISTFAYLGLGFVLLVWGPNVPALKNEHPNVHSAFARMRSHTLTVSYIATAVLLVCSYVIAVVASERTYEVSTVYGDMRARLSNTSLVIVWGALAVVLFLVISAGFALYADRRAKHGATRSPQTQNLPFWVYLIAALCVTSGSVLLYIPDAVPSNMRVSPWLTTGVIVGLLIFAAGYHWWIRRCAVPWDVTMEQEIWYRQVLEFRALRVLSSAFFLLPGLAYPDEPAVIALGVGLFCIPAFLVVPRPNPVALQSARA